MTPPRLSHETSRPHDPHVFGLICAFASAVMYTAANVCLRSLAQADIFWVTCIKAIPTVVLMGAILLVRRSRGIAFPHASRDVYLLLMAVGIIVQLGGNVMFQFSLAQVGLALAVPLTLGTMITGGAVLGRVWLGELVTPRTMLAMTLVMISIVVLSATAEQGTGVHASEVPNRTYLILGVAGACLSGFTYAFLNTTSRRLSSRGVSLPLMLFVITLTGSTSLALMSVWSLGIEGMLATPPREMAMMVAAGVFNAIGFVLLSKALHLVPLAQVNAVNASQTALAAIGGILVFHEPFTWPLGVGIALTAAGMLLLERPKLKPHEVATVPAVSVAAGVELDDDDA